MVDSDNSAGIKSVEVSGRLLKALLEADGALRLQDIACQSSMATSKAHKYLLSLCRVGLVRQDNQSRKYDLGPFAMRLGVASMSRDDGLAAASNVQDQVCKELGLTIVLSVWEDNGPIVIRIAECNHPVMITMRIGATMPITQTAAGRVFAAYMRPEQVQPNIERELASNSGMKTETFFDIVADVRRQGYCQSVGDYSPGINALSVPLQRSSGEFFAALTAIGSRDDLPPQALDDLARRLKRQVDNIYKV